MLILRCREGEGADGVLESKVWGNMVYRRLGSGVLPARGPWWLQEQDKDNGLICLLPCKNRKFVM